MGRRCAQYEGFAAVAMLPDQRLQLRFPALPDLEFVVARLGCNHPLGRFQAVHDADLTQLLFLVFRQIFPRRISVGELRLTAARRQYAPAQHRREIRQPARRAVDVPIDGAPLIIGARSPERRPVTTSRASNLPLSCST